MTDRRLEAIISVLLRTGVITSAAVVLLGGACYLAKHGHEQSAYRVFHATAPTFRSVSGVIHAAGPSNCQAVIQLGLLLLILTPVARVAFSLAGFALEHDRTYMVLTSIVLLILIYSLAGAR
ncbi:MAG TPA: DUF1634 domain-containing protein [Bryobacteraceae bacterium]|jgi:uncharacterized membrane protein|nr:DUF1634 domain-containing protein [Bryobacteraceae bacterium]